MRNEHFTYKEIVSQTEAWSQAMDVICATSLPNAIKYEQVLFTGCGSTYYLSMAAASLYQELTGRAARAVPGGELLFNPQTVLIVKRDGIPPHTLLFAISRSGTTTETVKAVKNLKPISKGM